MWQLSSLTPFPSRLVSSRLLVSKEGGNTSLLTPERTANGNMTAEYDGCIFFFKNDLQQGCFIFTFVYIPSVFVNLYYFPQKLNSGTEPDGFAQKVKEILHVFCGGQSMFLLLA